MEAHRDLKSLLRRDSQLNFLSSVIMLALLGMVFALAYAVLAGLDLTQPFILDNPYASIGIIGLLLAVIAYMGEQHKRVRAELLDTHQNLGQARDDITASYERLAFAHEVATIAGALEHSNAVEQVLRASLEHYDADAAAVVGDEVTLIVRDPKDTHQAHSAMLQTSLAAVRTGEPMSIGESGKGSAALSIPLRIHGRVSAVLCLWRRSGRFADEQLDGLGLVGRVLELAVENHTLLDEARNQLTGTLQALAHLIDKRIPHYAEHSSRIAAHAVSTGSRLGLTGGQLIDLRAAAILADVGMLELPERLLTAHRPLSEEERDTLATHPVRGAEVAAQANLSEAVQAAVQCHHERLNGSGFPRRMAGSQIPLDARIIAVCDAYDSLINPQGAREPLSSTAAARQITANAGGLYDIDVVRAFLKTLADERKQPAQKQVPTVVEAEVAVVASA